MAADISKIISRVQQVVQMLSQNADVACAYLFGSQIDGKADKWSDVDVAVFIRKFDRLSLNREFKLARAVHKTFGYDIELHFFDADYLPEPHPATFAGYVVRNGMRI